MIHRRNFDLVTIHDFAWSCVILHDPRSCTKVGKGGLACKGSSRRAPSKGNIPHLWRIRMANGPKTTAGIG
jgi:hypothetical protein